jgi:oligosaccharyltransferase complex subunit beta
MKIRIALAVISVSAAARKPCLVLSDSELSHGSFIKTLENNCDSVNVHSFSDKTVLLSEFGEYKYTDIVLMISKGSKFGFASESAEAYEVVDKYQQTTAEMQSHMATAQHVMNRISGGVGPGISSADIFDFIDNGKGNVLLAVQDGASSVLSEFLKNLGFGISKEYITDPFRDPTDGIVTSLPLETEPWIAKITGNSTVHYKGHAIGLSVDNERVFPILRASPTSKGGSKFSSQGLSLVLGGAHQTLNGGRIVCVGSVEAFNDAMAGNNSQFISNVVSWTFGNRGIIRLSDFVHHKVGELTAPRMYREKYDVEVSVKFEEKISRDKWTPYTASDIQIEYVMLDSHVREFMKYNPKTNKHELRFKIPDVYGIFKFRINHSRLGYNAVSFEQVAPVRNYRHNDYERFLFCAYPYYASSFVSLVLVAVFAAYFINHKDAKEIRHRE